MRSTLIHAVAVAMSVTTWPAICSSEQYGLLVGCTNYPNLDERFHLVGPANDVVLARRMLVDRFGFSDEHVVTLVEGEDDSHLPVKENIAREWRALAENASKGDQLFVLMAGHGTQTPQSVEDGAGDELDGLDEVFLPRDVGPWNDTVGAVSNAIKDDEIRDWIASIQAKGADLFVVIDACHSGTMTRAAGDEVRREIQPEALGIPEDSLNQASDGTEDSEYEQETQLIPPPERTRGTSGDADGPVLVALYAAQSIEPTVEKKMPRRGADRKYFGLLTYTMNEILSQAQSKLTYRELTQRIHRQYVKWGRVSPTPVLEGNGIDREVLGVETFPDRPQIQISGSRFSGFKIDSGSINGISSGTILAVYPPAGTAEADTLIGHVEVLDEGLTVVEAKVQPCTYGDLPEIEKLESGMRCEIVFVKLNDNRLRVTVDSKTDDGDAVDLQIVKDLQADLEDFISEHEQLIQFAESPEDADFTLRYRDAKNMELFLTPVSGWPMMEDGELSPLFGPAPEDGEFLGWLRESLTKISRAQMLLRVSGDASGSATGLNVAIVRDGANEKFGRGGINLYSGDKIAFEVENKGTDPLDVTILLIDSGYGIYPLFPSPGQTNRIFPDDKTRLPGTITADTTGLEHLVVIATKAKPVSDPVSFTFLAQSSIERSRAAGGEHLDSPLGSLLSGAMLGDGKTRGFAATEADNYEIQTLTWTTHAAERNE